MEILLICASPHVSGATKRALEECDAKLSELGAKTRHFFIGNEPRYACTACGKCKKGGGCAFGDLCKLTEALEKADGVIIGVPTHYGNAPGNLTSILTRLLFSSKKCVEFKPIAVVGAGRRGCICSAIGEVQRFFEFVNCPIISGSYPAMIYGYDYESAGFDAEGLQNMRSVSENMYWIASAIAIAEKNGLTHPIKEPKIKTDIPSLL